jgi:hypothetical protein
VFGVVRVQALHGQGMLFVHELCVVVRLRLFENLILHEASCRAVLLIILAPINLWQAVEEVLWKLYFAANLRRIATLGSFSFWEFNR